MPKDAESEYLQKWGPEIHEMSRILSDLSLAHDRAGEIELLEVPAPYEFYHDDQNLAHRLEHAERGLVLTRTTDGEFRFHQINDPRGLRYEYQKDDKVLLNLKMILA